MPPPRIGPDPVRRRPSRLGALYGPLLAAALVAGCSEADAETSSLVRTRFTPPLAYEAVWKQVETCSRRRGDRARVRWYHVASFPGQPLRLGQWEPDHAITLRSDLLEATPIVGHEILHELLGGDREHRDPAWLACALPVAGARGGVPPSPPPVRGDPEARGSEDDPSWIR